MSILVTLRECLSLLSSRDRRLLIFSTIIQMGTSLLDLLGVVLIGVVGALAVTAIQGAPPPPWADDLAFRLGRPELTVEGLVLVLAVFAAVVLLAKSVSSSYLMRRVLRFLASRQAVLSARLARQLLSGPLTLVLRRPSQVVAFSLNQGAAAATTVVLGQGVVAASELALLFVLGLALLVISPVIGMVTIVFFALVGYVLHRMLGHWAARVGHESADADIRSLDTIQEALHAYRELSVLNRRGFYVERFRALRLSAAAALADQSFVTIFPKYAYEAALVAGGFVLAIGLFATQGAVSAVGTLAVFLAAGVRIMPALIRLQTALLTIKNASSLAKPTLDLDADLGAEMLGPEEMHAHQTVTASIRAGYPGFEPRIQIADVEFTYPGGERPAIAGASLIITPGSSAAFVGASGAGKSTLTDLLLGLLDPDQGVVSISGRPAAEAICTWPGAITYVPQHVMLSNGSVRQNVALGLPDDVVSDELVWEALKRAQLDSFVRGTPEGLSTQIGERGVRLSGGQRQRLGLARALYTRPQLIILDEATSSLDAEAEAAITTMMASMDDSVTRVVVAHRLSTVRDFDTLYYLEHGRIVAAGSFEAVREAVPSFARQADIMGLR